MEIEKVLFEDFEKISELNKRNNLITLNKDDWINLWNKNPYFGQTNEWIIGWKLLDKEKIVGTCLNIPFIFELNNKEFLAAVCNNYVIDKNYRSFALKLRHLFLNQKDIDLYITNSANTESERIMEAFKAKKISQQDYQKRLLFIVNKPKFLFNYIKGLIVKDKNFSRKNNFQYIKEEEVKNKNITFHLKENFDNDFIQLTKELNNFSNLRSSKKLEWLKWKYNQYIERKKFFVVKIYKGQNFVGFIAMISNMEKKYSLKKLTIVEIVISDKENDLLNDSMKYCIDVSKKFNFDVIDVIGYKKSKRIILEKLGFIKKKSKNFNFLVKSTNSQLDFELFKNKENLDLSLTDGDNIFYLD